LKSEGASPRDWGLYDGQHVVFEPTKYDPTASLLENTRRALEKNLAIGRSSDGLSGSRTRLPIAIPANLGYRFYAYHLDTFYTCDWFLGGPQEAKQ